MDLYLDYDHRSRRRKQKRRRRRQKSKKPLILAILVVLAVMIAGGVYFGKKFISYRREQARKERELAEAKKTVTVMFPEG